MNNATIWEACHLYGAHILKHHNNPELFARWYDHFRDVETQLMCDVGGTKVEGTTKYTDGDQTWGPVRWPWKANTAHPEYHDSPRKFCFEDHLIAIGSSGWDWKNKQSRWLGYDFDSLVGHAAGVGTADSDLEAVAQAAPDFVDVIRSTRGAGKHLYIFFDEPFPKTESHTEHAALARAYLPVMSAAADFDFDARMDVCGAILWLWHKDATPENRGFTSIQEASHHHTGDDIPPNWRDHLDVVSGTRAKVRVRGWTPDGVTEGDELDEDTEQAPVVALEDVHKRILDDLEQSGYSFCWVHDHHLAQTHTCALKKVYLDWAAAGHPMKGAFDTTSPDSDPGKPNCYLRPRPGGGFDVYRFGKVEEHPLWEEVGGRIHTTFNVPPTLRQGALAAGGVECADLKAGFQMGDEESLYTALEYLGSDFRMPRPGAYDGRVFTLKVRAGDARMILSVTRNKDDLEAEFRGWEKKPRLWVRLLKETASDEQGEDQLIAHWDSKIRVLKSVSMCETGNVAGNFHAWLIHDSSDKWVTHPTSHISMIVGKEGLPPPTVAQILGRSVENAWTKVNRPFEPEYPGGREWNYEAAQFRFKPAILKDGEAAHHPHWDKVLNHCGAGLDQYVAELDWCQDWGIKCGGDYLKAWVAAMFRFPYQHLPYLFLYSEANNTGKSTLHEAIRILTTRGVVMADRAITSSQDFNGELANAVLGVIDEADISKAGRNAYNKVKEWVTGETISIRAMYKETYEQLNTLHLMQMANNRSACPVFGGDSRITVMEVPLLESEIAKIDLLARLEEEARHFMRTLMDLPLPKSGTRLRVPVIETQDKLRTIEDNRSLLEAFLDDHCDYVPGAATLFTDVHAKFLATLEQFEHREWPKGVLKRDLPDKFPVARWNSNKLYVGNLVFAGETVNCEDGTVFTKRGDRLMRETTGVDNGD